MFYFLTVSITSCGFLFLEALGQNMLGSGTWSVMSAQPCVNDAEMPWRVRLRRHKHNRTHDAFDGEVSALAELDDTYGARADICKKVEGGCKQFINKSHECLPCLVREHASENARTVLMGLGIDPPQFPIPKGVPARNYLLDIEDLSKQGVYGEYHGTGYIVKDGQDIACLRMSVKFEPIDNIGSLPSLYG